MQDIYSGEPLRSTPVGNRRGKQELAEGEVEVECRPKDNIGLPYMGL